MADVPRRLVGPLSLTAASVTVYTVPVATTTIVRSIHVNNINASNVYNFTMGINGTGATVTYALFTAFPIGSNGVLDWSGFLVLHANDTLTAYASAAAALALTVSGIETT